MIDYGHAYQYVSAGLHSRTSFALPVGYMHVVQCRLTPGRWDNVHESGITV